MGIFPFSTMGAMKNNAENINDWKCLHDQSPSAAQRPVGWQLGNWGERVTEASEERREGERKKEESLPSFCSPYRPPSAFLLSFYLPYTRKPLWSSTRLKW